MSRTSMFVLLLAGGSALAQGDSQLTVDRVVERFVAASGGLKAIRALDNIVYTKGLYEEGDYKGEGEATMSRGRPCYKLVGDKTRPGGYLEGYDGSAWEWFADPGVVIRTVGPASEAIRHYAGVEHPLIDYAAKGSRARLLGDLLLDEQPVVVVELTRRDGFVEQFYFDPETWLIVASGGSAPIHAFGDDVRRLTRISDYRPVGGVQIPHRFVSVEMPSGRALSSMQWRKIAANQELPADWFSPPDFTRTPVQAFIESLYGQRDDLQSMLWSYHAFRRAYPGIDTADPVNVAAFQVLKMGAVENAVGLLRRNVEDNPNQANARFGLGRALQRAGQRTEAREQFRRAVAIDPDHRRAKSALAKLLRVTE